MYAYVAAQAHKVYFAFVFFYKFDAICKLLVFEKRPVLDGVAQSHRFLRHYSARPDVLVSDFAVAHRAVGQTYVFAISMNQSVGIFAHKHGIGGDLRAFYGVIGILIAVGVVAPAVTDNQHERFAFQNHLLCHKTRPFIKEPY